MKPYMPSNGTDGMAFEDRWCANCAKDWKYKQTNDGADGCGILLRALCGVQPSDWVETEAGPTCLGFRVRTPRKKATKPGWKAVAAFPGIE